MNEELRFRLTLPFPTRESPFTETLQTHAIAWVQQFQLVSQTNTLQRFKAGQFWFLVSTCFPNGNVEALKLVMEWDSWAFMLDDQSDEGHLRDQPAQLRALLDGLLAVFDGQQQQEGPLFESLRNFWNTISQKTNKQWQARFYRSVATVFDGLIWEAHNRSQHVIPSLDDYIRMRRSTSGLASHMDLADLTDGIDLAPAQREDAYVVELTDCANNIISWTNDLFSFDKERQAQENHNLIVVLQDTKRISRKTAYEIAVGMIQDEIRHFVKLEHTIPAWDEQSKDQLKRYIGVLKSWMCGNLAWSQRTRRYTLEIQAPQKWLPQGAFLLLPIIVLISIGCGGYWLWQRRSPTKSTSIHSTNGAARGRGRM